MAVLRGLNMSVDLVALCLAAFVRTAGYAIDDGACVACKSDLVDLNRINVCLRWWIIETKCNLVGLSR